MSWVRAPAYPPFFAPAENALRSFSEEGRAEYQLGADIQAGATNGTAILRKMLQNSTASFFMYYVYILQSQQCSNKSYIGFTENLENRLKAHNLGDSFYTKKYTPWKIVWYCRFEDKKRALDFEKYLKTASGIAFRNKRLI